MRAIAFFCLGLLGLCLAAPVHAQGLQGMEKKILRMNKHIWAYFRDYNGRQLIYFTHLETYRCGIETVKYSLDSDALDKEWELRPCDAEKPNTVATDKPYIALPPGTAESITLQLTFTDGSKSLKVRIGADNQVLR